MFEEDRTKGGKTNDKGTYRFEFQAIDRGGKLSNIIDHFVLIQ